MKITIATGIFPPEIGGPAEYSKQLYETLLIQSHDVRIVTYKGLKGLPSGLRHLFYFLRLCFNSIGSEYIIALDTFSVGIPAVLFSKIFGQKVVVRVGGDFLWEGYLNRTREYILLSNYYSQQRTLTFKERMIKSMMGYVLRNADGVVFSTEWQKNIMQVPYGIKPENIFVIENYYPPIQKDLEKTSEKIIFLSPSRDIQFKNKKNITSAFLKVSEKYPDIILDTQVVSHEVLMERMRSARALIVASLSEVSPNIVIESLQYGTPSVLTIDNGIKNRLEDCAVYVDPLSVENIAQGIESMLDDNSYSELRKKINVRTFSHSWNEIAQEFLDLYPKL